ncbi:MAG TPA: universal stress protein [Solirubrobacteraceae bacterium]|nr:universal stress protein [Solirubrobacteraceae bacterium]
MTSPVVAAYDPQSQDAGPVRFALAAARFGGAPLLVVSVCAVPVGGEYPVPPEPDLRPEAETALSALEAGLEAGEVQITTRAVRGTSAPGALHKIAEREDAALLVVGSTDRGAAGRVLPGSTAERLMHGAPCPIAVVPHEWTEGGGLRTIGVAYVDTDEGRNALRGAHALARRAGATLRVLTVARVGAGAHAETSAPGPGRPGKDFDAVVGEHRARAESAVREVVSRLEGDVPVEVDAFLEDPADVLIGLSEHLDLLVCGSRGYGPLRAVMLGGVTRRVGAAAHCPVLVLPRGVELEFDGAEPARVAHGSAA